MMELHRFEAKIDDVVVASLYLYVVELPSRKLAVIEEVNTLPEYRLEGHATKLIKDAIKKARALGMTCVELTVNRDNHDAAALYRKLGFINRNNDALRLTL